MIVETVYVAIRRSQGSESEEADLATVSYHPEGCRARAREQRNGGEVARVARFELREVPRA